MSIREKRRRQKDAKRLLLNDLHRQSNSLKGSQMNHSYEWIVHACGSFIFVDHSYLWIIHICGSLIRCADTQWVHISAAIKLHTEVKMIACG